MRRGTWPRSSPAQAGQRDLFVAFFDQAHGVWGNPVRLTDDRASEAYPAPGLDPTGRLLMGYAATAITPVTHTTTVPETGEVVTYTLPTEGQTDLLTLSHAFVRNLTASADQARSWRSPTTIPPPARRSSSRPRSATPATWRSTAWPWLLRRRSGRGRDADRDARPAGAAGGRLHRDPDDDVYRAGDRRRPRSLRRGRPGERHRRGERGATTSAHLAAFGPDLELAAAGVEPWGGSDVGLVTVIRNLGTTTARRRRWRFISEGGACEACLCNKATLRIAGCSSFACGSAIVTDTIPSPGRRRDIHPAPPPGTSARCPGGSYTLTAVVNPAQADFAEVVTANNTQTLTWAVQPDPAVSPYYLWAELAPDDALSVTVAVMNWGAVEATGDVLLRLMLDNPITGTVFFSDTISNLPPASQILISARLEDATRGRGHRLRSGGSRKNDCCKPAPTTTWRPQRCACSRDRRLPSMIRGAIGEGAPNESHTFTAYVQPITATTPLTYTWQATGLPGIVHTGGLTDTAAFAWSADRRPDDHGRSGQRGWRRHGHAHDHDCCGHSDANRHADGHEYAVADTDTHADLHRHQRLPSRRQRHRRQPRRLSHPHVADPTNSPTVTPTASPTPPRHVTHISPTPTNSPTVTPTSSPTPTETPTVTPTASPTPTNLSPTPTANRHADIVADADRDTDADAGIVPQLPAAHHPQPVRAGATPPPARQTYPMPRF